MIIALWIVLVAVCLVLLLACGALVELYRDLEQVRVQSGVLDARTKVDVIGDRARLREAGLPSGALTSERAVLLIVSDRCSTCELLADRLRGGPPSGMWMLVQPHNQRSGEVWLAAHSLDGADNVIVDLEERIVDVLGIRLSPVAVRMRSGQVVAAHTVPSTRRLEEELKWLESDGHDAPEYGHAHETFEAAARQAKREVEVLNDTKV